MKTIFEAGAQVKKLQVENYLHIAELMSAMKMNSPPAPATVTPTFKPTYIFPSPTPTANNKFVLGESIFILRLFQSGALKGEIRIRPAPTFHPEFLQHLGKFCYKSPKDFVTTVNKVSPIKQLKFEIHLKNGHFCRRTLEYLLCSPCPIFYFTPWFPIILLILGLAPLLTRLLVRSG
jgi:hypothetical protein